MPENPLRFDAGILSIGWKKKRKKDPFRVAFAASNVKRDAFEL